MRSLSHSPEETGRVAAALATRLRPGDIVLLMGPLGAGKTEFVRHLAAALRCTDPVSSPSFVVMNLYRGPTPLCHFDLYRLSGPDEALEMGLADFVGADGVCAVEWPERAEELFEAWPVFRVRIAMGEGDERTIEIESPEGRDLP